MRSDTGLALNYLGEMQAGVQLADGTPVAMRVDTDYPLSGSVRIVVEPAQPREFALAIRIPAWSKNTAVTVAGQAVSDVLPGHYLQLSRKWTAGDEIQLQLNMDVRYESGDLEQAGHAALYRGPILLAADSRFAAEASAAIDVSKLGESQPIAVDGLGEKATGLLRPWLAVDVPTIDGRRLRLIDFASAGAATIEGQPLSTYRSWLPAQGLRPPRPVAWRPADKTQCGAGPIRFLWRASTIPPGEDRSYTVLIAATPEFNPVILRCDGPAGSSLVVQAESLAKLQPKTPYYWKLVAANGHGQSESVAPFKQFTIDPSLPPLPDAMLGRASDGLFTGVSLQGDVRAEYGRLVEARGWKPCAGPRGNSGGAVELDGQQGVIKFAIEEFPERDYTVSIWVRVTEFPGTRLGQIFSAWSRGMDDPLRLVVQGDQLFAQARGGPVLRNAGLEAADRRLVPRGGGQAGGPADAVRGRRCPRDGGCPRRGGLRRRELRPRQQSQLCGRPRVSRRAISRPAFLCPSVKCGRGANAVSSRRGHDEPLRWWPSTSPAAVSGAWSAPAAGLRDRRA